MAHKHSVYDTDAHFSINPFTRAIKNESTSKVAVIQHDHNSERFTFEIPRLVDGHDMSLCDRVEVHYINMDSANKDNISADIYEVDDLQVSPDDRNYVICSWLLSQNATKYAGSLNFLVRFVCLDGDEIAYAWHTAIFTGISVSSGILNNAEEIIEPYVDVLAQWKTQLFEASEEGVVNITTAETNALAEIEAAGEAKKQSVLDSIPDEYEELSQDVSTNAVKINELASAIKGSMSGAVVFADDVSPVEHSPVVTVHGKNLCVPNAITYTQSGYTVTPNDDGSVTVTGEASTTSPIYINVALKIDTSANLQTVPLKAGRKYILSAYKDGEKTTKVATKTVFANGIVDYRTAVYWHNYDDPTQDRVLAQLYIQSTGHGVGDTSLCGTYAVQIEEGEAVTDYTPYIDPSTVTVKQCGKNLSPCLTVGRTVESNGVTFTGKDNGGIGVSGTPTGLSACILYLSAPLARDGYITISLFGTYSNIVPDFQLLDADGAVLKQIQTGKGATINLDSYEGVESWRIAIKRESVDSAVSGTVYVQVEIGSVATTYEPYNSADYIPAADGTVSGLTSLSPNMTIFTDTDGAIVECEYNIDTKTYIDNKFKELMEGVTE